jgi:hypothetical protein
VDAPDPQHRDATGELNGQVFPDEKGFGPDPDDGVGQILPTVHETVDPT